MSSLPLSLPAVPLLGSLLPPTRPVPARLACRPVYLAGDEGLLLHPAVAIVGAREASPAALQRAFDLAYRLARAGVVVVSGLARGIDLAAHQGALAADGATVAVVATGLDRSYPPEHATLQAELAREHLVASPFPLRTPVRPGRFPQRNELMAALTDATVVLEAGDTSGTRHQVAACRSPDLARPVYLHRSLVEGSASWARRLAREVGTGSGGLRVFSTVSEVAALLLAGGAR